jgi:hypothetical protein
METLRAAATAKSLSHDLIDGATEYRIEDDAGRHRHVDSGMEVDDRLVERYTIRDGEPLSLKVHIKRAIELQREGWRVRVETDSEMTADATHFHVSNNLTAFEGDKRVFARLWEKAIPRHFA